MDNLQDKMNVGFGSRIMAFILATLMFFLIVGVVSGFVLASGETPAKIRIITVLQDLLLFIGTPVLTAVIANRLPARLLLLNKPGNLLPYVLVVVAMVVSVPVMNFLVELNASMSLPDSLSGVEEWMRSHEESANALVGSMMAGNSVADLILNILIMGVLAGFSEELFFRGGLQRLLITKPMNPHAAIWITAVLFSAFHLQFFGFFPRLLLGAWFGYLAWWSGTIWLPVVAHVLNNTVVVVSAWMLSRGMIGDSVDAVGVNGDGSVSVQLLLLSVALTTATVFLVYRCYKKRSQKD